MDKRKTCFFPGFFWGMFATIVIVAGIGIGLFFSSEGNSEKNISDKTKYKVNYLQQLIDKYYLEDADSKQLEAGVYKGLVEGLGDPYSVYYTAEEYQELMKDTSGVYYGIGAMMSQDLETGVITVIKVFQGTPAKKAGMLAGDVVYKVEGREVDGKDLNKVVADIKGANGTEVSITVYRSSENRYIDFKIVRDEINIPTIESKMLDKKEGIGYIQITEFDEVTYEQFVKALNQLKKQNMKGIIFDIRDNPGGLYDTVCSILDEILPKGVLVYTMDKYNTKEVKESDEKCLNMPMVVLQNENSASASEIFAGAIQDFDAGEIVGTQSFGKGIVQSVIPLEDGSAVKLTIQNYYTPKGKNIHGKGITPDVKKAADGGKKDVQLNTAKKVLEKLIKS